MALGDELDELDDAINLSRYIRCKFGYNDLFLLVQRAYT